MKKILPYLIILFLGCATKPEPLPDWVLHTKNNSENWQSVGIGLTRDIAINQATNSIATQISVQIESKIKSIKAERNYELQEFSRSIVESRVNISLPEVEIEEVINSNNFWYAKAKLNKDKYYKLLEQKRQNAKETALKILQDSKQLNKLDELKSIFMAYLEIKNYLDVPMLVNYNGQSNINLYSEIISLFKKCVQNIQILPKKNEYNLKSVIPLRKKIPIQIKSTDNKSVEGLPFLVQFNSGKTNSNLSVNNNSFQLIIDEVYPQKSSDILSIILDLKSILNIEKIPSPFKIHHLKNLTIEILPLNIFIESTESNLNKNLENQILDPIVTQYFINNYNGNITENINDCDLKVSIDVFTYKGNNSKNEWGIYKSLADFHFKITSCNTNQELFKFAKNQIQGGDFNSYKNAGSQAINNLATELKKDILPLMDKTLSQN